MTQSFYRRFNMAYLRPKEVAQKLGVTVITIYNWIKAGILPFIKPKHSIFIDEKDLEKFLKYS